MIETEKRYTPLENPYRQRVLRIGNPTAFPLIGKLNKAALIEGARFLEVRKDWDNLAQLSKKARGIIESRFK